MRATVDYAGSSLDFPIDRERLVGAWSGPGGRSGIDVADELRASLDAPLDFPSLRQAIVPGDRVLLALDPRVPELATLVATVVNVLEDAGVDRGSICALASATAPEGWEAMLPAGIAARVHDPDDREAMAYLATTSADRRVYLSREATDADFVLPIGLVTRHSLSGTRGPWSVIFPGLSDQATRQDFAAKATASGSKSGQDEAGEVGWLLGNLFQIGVIAGASGVVAIVAGSAAAVKEQGLKAFDAAWTFRVDRRADLVVVGVGSEAGVEGTWTAFGVGASLVRRGGKVVALSGAGGLIGPAAQRLSGAEGPGEGIAALRGAEGEPDFLAARQLADAMAWADLYLFSRLDPDLVEELGIVPLSKPEEARRLASASPQITLVSHADLTRGQVAEDDE